MQKDPEINVLGAALAACSQDPVTGFFATGIVTPAKRIKAATPSAR